MGSERYPLQQKGIFHNLPTFDPSIKGLTAIVTGANGISGFHTMRALLDSPERWVKIYALSRRPPPKEMMALLPELAQSRVQHVAVDFLTEPQKIADAIRAAEITADYIFFYSYLQPKPPSGAAVWSNVEELVNVNTALLDNFLKALPLANVHPKRFLLQTGAKNYGLHIGTIRTPAIESDPQPVALEPNFYYPQERSLFEYSRANNVPWNVIRPAWILGAVNNAQMNALHPFAVYSAVQAYKGEPLYFPSDWATWRAESHHSTAMLTGYLSEWVVLEDKAKNEAFNATDTSGVSWDRIFEELVRWFGVEKGVHTPEEDASKFKETVFKGGKNAPMGYGPPTVFRQTFSLVDWASEKVNQDAWKALQQQSGGKLTDDPFTDPEAGFAFGDAALSAFGTLSMSKARRLGWAGFVDELEAIFEMYREMGLLGMVPKMKVDKPKPLA